MDRTEEDNISLHLRFAVVAFFVITAYLLALCLTWDITLTNYVAWGPIAPYVSRPKSVTDLILVVLILSPVVAFVVYPRSYTFFLATLGVFCWFALGWIGIHAGV